MQRHVIIEGPDGGGKTKLAMDLCRDHGYAYHHEGAPPKGDLLIHYLGLLMNAQRPTVFDRLHLGELVYGPLLRGTSGLTNGDVNVISRAIIASGTAIVICLPPKAVCMENTRRRDEFIKDEQMRSMAYNVWVIISQNEYVTPNTQLWDYAANGSFKLVRYPIGGHHVA